MLHISEESWGQAGGMAVTRTTLQNERLSVSVLDFGATVQKIVYEGKDLIFSLPDAALYERYHRACIGATVGRCAGRIANGRFRLNGCEVELSRNEDGHHLHGGFRGFHTRMWERTRAGVTDAGAGLCLRLISPDGDEGYPGDLTVTAEFIVTEDDRLAITYTARVSGKTTVVSMTNHCYFNLNGMEPQPDAPPLSDGDNRDIRLWLDADRVLELDGAIPTGRLLPVEGTPFDFREARPLVRRKPDAQEPDENGFDHTFVFRDPALSHPSVTAYSVRSGIRLECFTDQPGTQLFTMGNPGNAFALEPQHFPDSPHHPGFPSVELREGETRAAHIVYRFSREETASD